MTSQCKGNTTAVTGIILLGGACIAGVLYARDKDTTISLSPLIGVALGGLVQYITNRTGAPDKPLPPSE